MSNVAALYTSEILALATGLAQWRLDDGLPMRGSARSSSCGSTLTVGLALSADGRVVRIGVGAQACAIGQAAAAIMAAAAQGRDEASFAACESELLRWLAGDEFLPNWPGIEILAPARAYPGRHGALLLGWRAVLAAFALGAT